MQLLSIIILTFWVYSSSAQDKTFQDKIHHYDSLANIWIPKFISNISEKLNLNKICTENNGFEFRFWNSSRYSTSLVIIKKLDERWLMSQTFYWQSYSDTVKFLRKTYWEDLLKVRVDSSKTYAIVPNPDISKIVDSLKKFQLYNIPNQADIKDFRELVADGNRYIFEICSSDGYKLIHYISPDLFYNRDKFNKRITDLIRFIRKYCADII